MNNISINDRIQGIINLYNSGRNPQQLIQNLIRKNPQFNTLLTQISNMAQGKSMPEFLLQLAKQNGVSESNIQGIARILGAR